MLKFVAHFDEAKHSVRDFLMEIIKNNENLLTRFEIACKQSSSQNIDDYLDRAVYTEFKGIVVIDEARPELFRVLEKIRADISVLELKAFELDDGQRMFQFDTLYDDGDEVGEPKQTKHALETPDEHRNSRAERKKRKD